jgi:hypothetical protein
VSTFCAVENRSRHTPPVAPETVPHATRTVATRFEELSLLSTTITIERDCARGGGIPVSSWLKRAANSADLFCTKCWSGRPCRCCLTSTHTPPPQPLTVLLSERRTAAPHRSKRGSERPVGGGGTLNRLSRRDRAKCSPTCVLRTSFPTLRTTVAHKMPTTSARAHV